MFPAPPPHQELSEGTGKTPGLEEEPKAELDFPFGSPLWAGVEGDDKGLRTGEAWIKPSAADRGRHRGGASEMESEESYRVSRL